MKKAVITEKDICELLTGYDNNNANQVYTSGGLEYSLFEMVSKKFMRTQYSPEWKKAIDGGYTYCHDSAQELFKGINCLSGANNIIVKDSNGNVFPINLEYFVNELFGTEDFYVPTVNIKTGYTEWKKVLNAFCTGFDDIYRLRFTKGLSIECTSDHKFLRANLKHTPYNCKKDSYRSLDDGLDNENILNLYKIDYKNINNYYQSALFGFFLGDGTLNKQTLTFRFAFKKEDKAEYLEFLCDKLNLKFNKTYQKSGYIYYSFPDYKIDKYYSKSELINKYKKNLHMKGLLEGLINSDGSIKLDENNVVRCDFVSTNKDIYDLYITACFVNGLKHSYHKRNNGGNRKDSYHTTVAGCGEFLSSINLRNSFIQKIGNSTESNKKYNDNNYIKLKDSEYIGYDRVYNLSIEDNHNFMAGIGGFVLVKNCFTLDPREVIRKGLRTYGDNNIGVTSNPPKHFDTALELIEQTMGLAVVYCAGGIACASINTFLAPFMVGESDKNIKQALQSLLFQMNQSFKNRGSQSMFSSLNMDLEMPEWLKKETAYGRGGKPCGVYGDYQDEAKRFVHLLTEVSIEGDAEDKPLFMPNLIYNIDGADLNEWLDVFELSAKFSSPYFCHYRANNVEYQSTLGCRSALPANWTGDPNIDCMGLGNSVYTTVSLPAIALKTVEENTDFYKELDYYMELVREYNKNRLDWIKKLWYKYHTADFMIQKMPSGRPLYDLDNATIVCGYLGLSEALEILGYGDITVANDKAREIMTYMGDKIAGWKNEDNLRYGLFQTPAENLAYKNAQKMVKKYGFKRSHAKGTATRPYYTNSNHVPVDSDIGLVDKIRIEGNNQPIGAAGNIMNVYLGESYSEASALKSLCEKIRDNTNAYFWAFTGDYAICPECNSKFKGNIEECPFDGAETDVYSRVTGYLTNTKTWNAGKREELVRRHRY